MHCTYVLYSFPYNRLYIGETSHLINRFHSHNTLATKGYTTRYRPWLVIHVEFFDTRKLALAQEKQLKSGQGRQWLKEKVLSRYL